MNTLIASRGAQSPATALVLPPVVSPRSDEVSQQRGGFDQLASQPFVGARIERAPVTRVTPEMPAQVERPEVFAGAQVPVAQETESADKGLPFIEQAMKITDGAIQKVYDTVRPGMTEKDVAKIIEDYFAEHGYGLSFPTISVSGPNTTAVHGVPSDRVIEENDIIMIDLGARYEGPEGPWTSDVTRTFFVGQPTERQQEIWEIVHEAQRRALAAVKPGVRASEIDRIARNYIREHGFRIPHAVGHGVGRKVHVPPTIGQWGRYKLKVGDIITVEPGIYSRQDGFGVRVEDTIVVTEDGFRYLSHAPYERTQQDDK